MKPDENTPPAQETAAGRIDDFLSQVASHMEEQGEGENGQMRKALEDAGQELKDRLPELLE